MIIDFRQDLNKIDRSPKRMGITSGIKALDEVLLGFSKGELITIGARPGIGKSSLARGIMLAACSPEQKDGVGILCTLEATCTEVFELSAANLGKVNYDTISRGMATESTLSRFETACTQLSSYNIIVDYDSYITPDAIRALLCKVREQESISCLLIDYLQLMSLRKKVDNRQTEVQEISRELKAIAGEFDIPVIAFSQLNRNAEYRESAKPRMTDLRESGAMENDSSKVILIHRPSYYYQTLNSNAEDTGETEFIVCKNRKGRLGIVKAAWISEWMGFQDIPEEEF